MTKESILCGFMLALASAMFVAMAPGLLSLAFVALAVIACIIGFIFGIMRVCSINRGLKTGRSEVIRSGNIQTDNPWLAIRQIMGLFDNRKLDRVFDRYVADVEAARSEKSPLLPDIEDYINEGMVGLYTWRGVVLQIPSVLTGIGILGTFVGLIVGVGNVGFSSVTAALNGVEALLSGIEVAFYTSIAGLSLSILFNLMYRMVWNVMLRNMENFVVEFHGEVIPSADQQERAGRIAYQQRVIELLEGRQLAEALAEAEKAAAEKAAAEKAEA